MATETKPDEEKQLLASCMKRRPNASIVFDIETGPLDEATIRERSKPFEPLPHPGEFDSSAVKTGNLKDPVKISQKINAARREHEKAVTQYDANNAKAEKEYWAGIFDKAALSPLLGRVIAIGIGHSCGQNDFLTLADISDESEQELLDQFWSDYFYPIYEAGQWLVGHNIADFDVPFLVRRSWLLGVDVPRGIYRGRYLSDAYFMDTRQVWNCGVFGSQIASSLDDLATAFGFGGKPEDVCGADFYRLYTGSPEERTKAMDYLANDVEMTRRLALCLGLI